VHGEMEQALWPMIAPSNADIPTLPATTGTASVYTCESPRCAREIILRSLPQGGGDFSVGIFPFATLSCPLLVAGYRRN